MEAISNFRTKQDLINFLQTATSSGLDLHIKADDILNLLLNLEDEKTNTKVSLQDVHDLSEEITSTLSGMEVDELVSDYDLDMHMNKVSICDITLDESTIKHEVTKVLITILSKQFGVSIKN